MTATYILLLILLAIFYYPIKSWLRPTRRPPSRKATQFTQIQATGEKIECRNPATGELLGTVQAYKPEQVRTAVSQSREAQREWRQSSFVERRALLQDILDWVVEAQDQIVTWSMQDSGKTVLEAVLGEVMTSCEKIRWIIQNGENALSPESRSVAALLAFTKSARVEYHPLGVIGIIVPWNYPVHNVISAVVAALFAGNGAVVKVSEYASHSARPLETALRNIIARRGYNAHLLQIITGYAETGEALVTGGVDKILFIGSPQVGALVQKSAAAKLTPVILELGGKDPFIIFNDVDFDHVLDVAIRGAFINCGQNCISAERFYVQSKVYDRFCEAISAKVKELAQGASIQEQKRCDFGAMTMPAQVKIVERLVKDAIEKGAKVLTGGGRVRREDKGNSPAPNSPKGSKKNINQSKDKKESKGNGDYDGPFYYPPTILKDVTHKMAIANEEAFGPVMTIIKFYEEKDLFEVVNTPPYGLGSSIFTTDLSKAKRIGAKIESGMVCVNDYGMVPMVQSLPFGGCKNSGYGVFNGVEGLRGFSRMQSIVTDRWPGVRTFAPPFLRYPIWSNSHEIIKEAVRLVYGKTYLVSFKALVSLLKLVIRGR